MASGYADTSIRIWEVLTGTQINKLLDHEDVIRGLCFSGDGKTLASGSSDMSVCIWDVEQGNELSVLSLESKIELVRFSCDGSRIACGFCDNVIQICEVVSERVISSFRGHEDRVYSLCFSDDGSKIASASFDHSIRIWDAVLGTELFCVKDPTRELVVAMCFSHDVLQFGIAWKDRVQEWNLASGLSLNSCTYRHIYGGESVLVLILDFGCPIDVARIISSFVSR